MNANQSVFGRKESERGGGKERVREEEGKRE